MISIATTTLPGLSSFQISQNRRSPKRATTIIGQWPIFFLVMQFCQGPRGHPGAVRKVAPTASVLTATRSVVQGNLTGWGYSGHSVI